ncbi:MAG: rubrerythrin family protein [bacterium]
MTKTEKNLEEAFAGESQANRRYTAWARQADAEGYPEVAELFRSVAEGETAHALGHFNHMKGVKTTAENLKKAAEGESYEVNEMYPRMVKEAHEEGLEEIAKWFEMVGRAESSHMKAFEKVLSELE